MELPQDLAGGEPQLYLNHPPWTQPIGGEFMGLKVNNSLTGPEGRASEIKELVDFVPAHGKHKERTSHSENYIQLYP